MDYFNLKMPKTDTQPAVGKLLIAEPFLSDPNFSRSVIYLCEHGEEGSVGFVLNKATDISLGDLLPEIYKPFTNIFRGGPVQIDTLHMLHRIPQVLGGNEVRSGVYLGGSYEALQDGILTHTCEPGDMRLFVGYSGWSAGQLEKELKEGSWIVADANEHILFEVAPDEIWKEAIRLLGSNYGYLVNLPVDPRLN